MAAISHPAEPSTWFGRVVALARGALAAGVRGRLFVVPSDTVITPIGAGGYAAALIGMFAFTALVTVSLLGLHNPLRQRHPIRAALCLLWLSVLASYVLMDRNALTVPELASADRLLMQLAVITGVALIAADFLRSLHDVRRVLRVLCWGGAFCGVVAALQFWISLDVSPYLRDLPGFSLNVADIGIGNRGGLNRVSGTAIYPIELGVVAGMLLPLAVYLAIYDTTRSAPAPLGAGGADRAHDPGVGVALGGHLSRRGCGGARGHDAGAPPAGLTFGFAVRPGGRLHDGPG